MSKTYNKKLKWVRSNPRLGLLRTSTLILIIQLITNFTFTLRSKQQQLKTF